MNFICTKMSKKFLKAVIVGACCSLIFFTSCQKNRLDVDVSHIQVELTIQRFEQDLFNNQLTDTSKCFKDYPYFYEDYTRGVLGFSGSNAEVFNQLMMYKTDVNAKKLYQWVNDQYKDFTPYKTALTDAYKHFKFYFPDESIPKIITYTSNFSFYMNPVGQDYIGIGLDMHLGKDFKVYDQTNIELYWRKMLIPETVVPFHMIAHANDLFMHTNKGYNYTDEMIYQGKLLYFLDAMMPQLEDHFKIAMTPEELEWCRKEEHNIWSFLVKEKYIYSTNKRQYEKLLKEGPRTVLSGVPEQAPAMIGKYIGWMAVRKYMNEHPDIDLKTLMLNSNAQSILQESAYKP
jgi:hypothetical protein